ncbi:FHA domain-containing protein [Oscillatoria acuminata]
MGRRSDHDIVLPNNCSLVSGKHLEIMPPTTADGNWTIFDTLKV